MEIKIWNFLAKILLFRKDLINILEPFLKNLNNKSRNKKYEMNDEKYIPFLKSFSKYQLELFHKFGIITKNLLNNLLIDKNDSSENMIIDSPLLKINENQKLDEIIGGDKCEELIKLINEKDINQINTITASLNDTQKIIIPIIQYCIMKKAKHCFNFLILNGIDDPTRIMEVIKIKEEENIQTENSSDEIPEQKRQIKKYEWDCMATAIYFGDIDIIKLLEEKGFKKGINLSHIEAAILSYRNSIVKEIIDNNETMLNKALFTSTINNNITGIKLLIGKGININIVNE